MPGIHASGLSQAINVHGVVPQQLVGPSYLCQCHVPWPRLGLTGLCIDVSKESLHSIVGTIKFSLPFTDMSATEACTRLFTQACSTGFALCETDDGQVGAYML